MKDVQTYDIVMCGYVHRLLDTNAMLFLLALMKHCE